MTTHTIQLRNITNKPADFQNYMTVKWFVKRLQNKYTQIYLCKFCIFVNLCIIAAALMLLTPENTVIRLGITASILIDITYSLYDVTNTIAIMQRIKQAVYENQGIFVSEYAYRLTKLIDTEAIFVEENHDVEPFCKAHIRIKWTDKHIYADSLAVGQEYELISIQNKYLLIINNPV